MSETEFWAEWARIGLAFSAVVLAYVGPLRWARIASWRQDLFEIRNELWDRMRERGSLESPAHIKVRDVLNGMIRVAPTLNLGWVAYLLWRCPPLPGKKERTIAELIADVPDPMTAEYLRVAYEAAAYQLKRRLFFTTFPGVLIVALFAVVDRCFRAAALVTQARSRYSAQIRDLMSKVGEAEACAVPA